MNGLKFGNYILTRKNVSYFVLEKNPPAFQYHIGGRDNNSKIKQAKQVKDLGVHVSDNLTSDAHITEIVGKASRVVFTIKRTMGYLTEKVGKYLFTGLVRPILEYAAPAWNPYKIKDVDYIEKVQRRFTKMIPSLRNLPYTERLKRLNLFSLRHRRRRGDLIQLFSLIRENSEMVNEYYFRSRHATRGHNLKLSHSRAKLDVRKYSFFVRVVADWNSLPSEVVNCANVNCFKRNLDKHWANEPSRFL